MLHQIEYGAEKRREWEAEGVSGSINDQHLRGLRAASARYRCEDCREWKADTRARRAVLEGTRYLSNLCDGCANAARVGSYSRPNGDGWLRSQLPARSHAHFRNATPMALPNPQAD